MKILLAAAAALTTLVAAAPAEAQYRDHYRDWRQEQRIRHGYHNGQLSGREAYRLQRQQNRIDAYRRHSWRDDGRLSWNERRNLDRMRDRASRNIYRQRHDYNRW